MTASAASCARRGITAFAAAEIRSAHPNAAKYRYLEAIKSEPTKK
jgi:hypothetical protein